MRKLLAFIALMTSISNAANSVELPVTIPDEPAYNASALWMANDISYGYATTLNLLSLNGWEILSDVTDIDAGEVVELSISYGELTVPASCANISNESAHISDCTLLSAKFNWQGEENIPEISTSDGAVFTEYLNTDIAQVDGASVTTEGLYTYITLTHSIGMFNSTVTYTVLNGVVVTIEFENVAAKGR